MDTPLKLPKHNRAFCKMKVGIHAKQQQAQLCCPYSHADVVLYFVEYAQQDLNRPVLSSQDV